MANHNDIRTRTIVVIEDDRGMLDLITLILTKRTKLTEPLKGIEVRGALSGPEGLGLMANTKPDLILSDDMMPVWDGPEVLKRLKADPDLSHVPVIMMTAKGGAEVIPGYLQMGAAECLIKPFTPRDLIDMINKFLGPDDWEGS